MKREGGLGKGKAFSSLLVGRGRFSWYGDGKGEVREGVGCVWEWGIKKDGGSV